MRIVKIKREVAVKAARIASELNDAYNNDEYARNKVIDLELLRQAGKKYIPGIKPRRKIVDELEQARVKEQLASNDLKFIRDAADAFDPNINRIKAWEAVSGNRWPHYRVWPGAETDPYKYEIED